MNIRLLSLGCIALALSALPAVAAPAKAAPPPAAVEPEALQALQRMSAYLGTLGAFEVKAQTALDLVLDDGQKVQIDGVTTYKVRRPNGFVIETTTARKARQFIYDGRKFTVYAPQLGFYAQVDAPPTIRQTLDAAYDRYGIVLPLDDLFRWSEPGERAAKLTSGFRVGDALIDGALTDQYAFRQDDVDWEVWIQKGDQPLPRKVVIVDRADAARPAYSTRLAWTLNPALGADAFAFHPAKDALPIRLAGQ